MNGLKNMGPVVKTAIPTCPGLVVPGGEPPLYGGGNVLIAHNIPEPVRGQHQDVLSRHLLVLNIQHAHLTNKLLTHARFDQKLD
jgi:hypothetical protein